MLHCVAAHLKPTPQAAVCRLFIPRSACAAVFAHLSLPCRPRQPPPSSLPPSGSDLCVGAGRRAELGSSGGQHCVAGTEAAGTPAEAPLLQTCWPGVAAAAPLHPCCPFCTAPRLTLLGRGPLCCYSTHPPSPPPTFPLLDRPLTLSSTTQPPTLPPPAHPPSPPPCTLPPHFRTTGCGCDPRLSFLDGYRAALPRL